MRRVGEAGALRLVGLKRALAEWAPVGPRNRLNNSLGKIQGIPASVKSGVAEQHRTDCPGFPGAEPRVSYTERGLVLCEGHRCAVMSITAFIRESPLGPTSYGQGQGCQV